MSLVVRIDLRGPGRCPVGYARATAGGDGVVVRVDQDGLLIVYIALRHTGDNAGAGPLPQFPPNSRRAWCHAASTHAKKVATKPLKALTQSY